MYFLSIKYDHKRLRHHHAPFLTRFAKALPFFQYALSHFVGQIMREYLLRILFLKKPGD